MLQLEEIEEVVRQNFDKTVEFVKTPSAEQYRESQMIRRQMGQNELTHEEIAVTDYEAASNTSASSPSISGQRAASATQARITSSANRQTRTNHRAVSLDPSKTYLKTKWGIYEMPESYSIKLTYGPRTDIQPIIT